MTDYGEMYLDLFRHVTAAIHILQKGQQRAEDRYINHEDPEILTILNDKSNCDETK